MKLTEDIDQNMKYIAVKGLAEPFPEIGESSFARNTVGETRIFPVSHPLFYIPNNFQELVHMFKPFHMPEQVSEEDARGVIRGRGFHCVTMGYQRTDERKVN